MKISFHPVLQIDGAEFTNQEELTENLDKNKSYIADVQCLKFY